MGHLIFIIYKPFDVDFFVIIGDYQTHIKKHSKYKESIKILCFSKKVENLGLFDVHETFMMCKYNAM
jgi:hypothetical protein